MKTIILLLIVLLIIGVGGKFLLDYVQHNTIPFFRNNATVTINNTQFKAYVPKTEKEKQIGLSDRSSLDLDSGMLFTFGQPDYYPFWMKNMKFPLDMIFINKGRIVTMYSNVQPASSPNPPLYKPDEPSDSMLEINAGLVEKYNIKKGDEVKVQQ